MRRTLRRYFWLAHVGSTLLIGLLLAVGVNALGASLIADNTPYPEAQKPPPPSKEADKKEDDMIEAAILYQRPLFQRQEADEEGDIVDETPDGDPDVDPDEAAEAEPLIDTGPRPGEPIPTDLPITLLGTQVATDRQWSIAIIKTFPEGEQERGVYLREGQNILEDATILQIIRDRVYFSRHSKENQVEYISIYASKQDVIARQEPAKEEPPEVEDTKSPEPSKSSRPKTSSRKDVSSLIDPSRIKKLSGNEYSVPLDLANEIRRNRKLLNDPKFGPKPKLSPYYKNRRVAGFRVIGVQPNSFYHSLGIRSGDTIISVNGEIVDKPQKAIALFDALGPDSNVDVKIDRRGTPKTLTYSMQ